MGNTKGKRIREEYLRQNFQISEIKHDSLLGSFTLIQFLHEGVDSYVMIKVLDPRIYDEYTDIQEAIKKLNQEHPQISCFYFVEENRQNPEIYDVAFEYGESLNTFISDEGFLWRYIDQVIEGMIYLESQGFHYPTISKQYLLLTKGNTIKLVNPYVFTDFMKEILQIYLNPQNPVSNRHSYFMMQISRNIKELGIMLATLVSNCNEYQLKSDQAYSNKVIDAVGTKFSKQFVNFMKSLIFNQGQLKNFKEVKLLSGKLKTQYFSESTALSSNSQIDPSKDTGSFPQNRKPSQSNPQPQPFNSQIIGQSDPSSSYNSQNLSKSEVLGQNQDRKIRIFDDFPMNAKTPNPILPFGSVKMAPLTPELNQKKTSVSQPFFQNGSSPPFLNNLPTVIGNQTNQIQNPQVNSNPLTKPFENSQNNPPIANNLTLNQLPLQSPLLSQKTGNSLSVPNLSQFQPIANNPKSTDGKPLQALSTIQNISSQSNVSPLTQKLSPSNQNPGDEYNSDPKFQTTPFNLNKPPNQQYEFSQTQPLNQKARETVTSSIPEGLNPLMLSFDKLQNFQKQGLTPESALIKGNEGLVKPPVGNLKQEQLPQNQLQFDPNVKDPVNQLQKRTSLNSEPIIHQNDKPHFLFVNGGETINVNLNSYMQLKEEGVNVGNMTEVGGSLNISLDFFDIEKKVFDKELTKFDNKQNNQLDFFFQKNQPSVLSSETEAQFDKSKSSSGFLINNPEIKKENEIVFNKTTQEMRKQDANFDDRTPQPQQPFVNQSPSTAQTASSNPQKQINKLHIKWLASEGRHQKLVEYEDKSFEEIPFSEEEKTKFIVGPSKQAVLLSPYPQPVSTSLNIQPQIPQQSQQPLLQQPQQTLLQPQFNQTGGPKQVGQLPKQDISDGKASHVVSYNIPNEFQGDPIAMNASLVQSCFHMSLLPQGTDKLLLLFRSKPVTPSFRFQEISGIVNKKDPLLCSNYHNVEPVGNQSAVFSRKEISVGDLNYIKKEEYLKPVSIENFSRIEKQGVPTALTSTARIIKKI
jgi:hypothetical protein